jgi:chorismate mutase
MQETNKIRVNEREESIIRRVHTCALRNKAKAYSNKEFCPHTEVQMLTKWRAVWANLSGICNAEFLMLVEKSTAASIGSAANIKGPNAAATSSTPALSLLHYGRKEVRWIL